MKSSLTTLLFILLCYACSDVNKGHGPIGNDQCFEYPTSIDSLNFRELYDSARLYVYTWHCDKIYLSKNDSSKLITYGELPLQFDAIGIRHDTVELTFDFLYGQEPILPSMTRNTMSFVTGVGFKVNTRSKIYMLSPDGYSIIRKGNNNRYENPLNPEVLSYLKNNWTKIHPCFRSLVDSIQVFR